jgi:hypothetical protein
VLTGERVAPSEAPPTVLRAEWSNWWGSPQLYARLVARISREVGEVASTHITFQTDGHEERFDSVDAFLAQVSPEMLRGFATAECSVRGFACEVELMMRRDLVDVEVSAPDPQDAQIALARIVEEANRGYRPYWGPAKWPGDVARKTRYQRAGGPMRDLLDVAAAVVFGVVSALAAIRISGQDDLPSWAIALIVMLGANVVLLINRAVPAVEIAMHGRTRLRVLSMRLAGAAGASIVAQVLALVGLSPERTKACHKAALSGRALPRSLMCGCSIV